MKPWWEFHLPGLFISSCKSEVERYMKYSLKLNLNLSLSLNCFLIELSVGKFHGGGYGWMWKYIQVCILLMNTCEIYIESFADCLFGKQDQVFPIKCF